MTADAPELLCQVCGGPLDGDLVWCVRCDTAHHADCFEFSGGCSTYGCGSKRSRRRPPAPSSALTPTVPSATPLIILDQDTTSPRRAAPVSPPAAARRPRTSRSWLAGLVPEAARTAGMTMYLVFLPGSLLWYLPFGLARSEHRNRTRKEADGVGDILTSGLGTTGMGVIYALGLAGGLIYLARTLLVRDPGAEWLVMAAAAYLLLVPALSPMVEKLAGLPLPDRVVREALGSAPPHRRLPSASKASSRRRSRRSRRGKARKGRNR